MVNIRYRIQQQVFRLNGLALNEFDISQPPGDPGLFGPDSVIWRVHGDFSSMMCGGISALFCRCYIRPRWQAYGIIPTFVKI